MIAIDDGDPLAPFSGCGLQHVPDSERRLVCACASRGLVRGHKCGTSGISPGVMRTSITTGRAGESQAATAAATSDTDSIVSPSAPNDRATSAKSGQWNRDRSGLTPLFTNWSYSAP